MGYPTWRANAPSIYVKELTVGVNSIIPGPGTTIADNIAFKADRNNDGIIYVSWQNAGTDERFGLYAGDSLSSIRITGFDVVRVYASKAAQKLWIYAELPGGL